MMPDHFLSQIPRLTPSCILRDAGLHRAISCASVLTYF
ncbi:hypothetical protein OHAE_68 [Ochrobactrum soli]|uniref:Uncharacterized protein n=1 Tax=Ochrobactrum soli TaxID=2448455 RepID=A0A2P9HJ82_9HYPH|nr:hypothetical protein OHAE_68 [[Ochrobactrum] soli]